MSRVKNDCRCCHKTSLVPVFDLGEQPHANAFLTQEQLEEVEVRDPLVLMECVDCGMVQLQHVVSPERLFSDYVFMTSSSPTMVEHFTNLILSQRVPDNGLIVEIGSNDGSVLASVKRQRNDLKCIGVDPSTNLTAIAANQAVLTVCDFFTEKAAKSIEASFGKASLIVACNVLGHIDDLDSVCEGVKLLLAKDGKWVIEVPSLTSMLERTAFDTIYHEHLSYFSTRALTTLLQRHALQITKLENQTTHGGSVRYTVQHGHGSLEFVHEPLRDWKGFERRVISLKEGLVSWLQEQKRLGNAVLGYGAPAKATVLLNYCGISRDLLLSVIDSTPTKQGKHVPGTHQYVGLPDYLYWLSPKFVLILAWNYAEEIIKKESRYMSFSGEFILPQSFIKH